MSTTIPITQNKEDFPTKYLKRADDQSNNSLALFYVLQYRNKQEAGYLDQNLTTGSIKSQNGTEPVSFKSIVPYKKYESYANRDGYTSGLSHELVFPRASTSRRNSYSINKKIRPLLVSLIKETEKALVSTDKTSIISAYIPFQIERRMSYKLYKMLEDMPFNKGNKVYIIINDLFILEVSNGVCSKSYICSVRKSVCESLVSTTPNEVNPIFSIIDYSVFKLDWKKKTFVIKKVWPKRRDRKIVSLSIYNN